MKPLPKFFLLTSLLTGVVGLFVTIAPFDFASQWALALPTAAILFGMFVIARVLQNEMAAFDQEAARPQKQSVAATASTVTPPPGGQRFASARA